MAEPKTRPTNVHPMEFIATVDEKKRDDAQWLLDMMTRVTGERPVMWGSAIVGFGEYTYIGSNNKPMTWPMSGFSPRKQNLTVYLMPGFEHRTDRLDKLGPHSIGVSCLYMKRLDEVDRDVLVDLVKESFDEMRARTKNGTVPIRPVSEYLSSDVKKSRDATKKTATKTAKRSAKSSTTTKTAAGAAAAKKKTAAGAATKTRKTSTKKTAKKKTAAKTTRGRR